MIAQAAVRLFIAWMRQQKGEGADELPEEAVLGGLPYFRYLLVTEFLLPEEPSSSTSKLWERSDDARLEGRDCHEQMIRVHLAYFWLCSRDSVPKMSETKDQVKRSRRGFYHLIQPLGAMTHAVRDDASTFALDWYNSSGVTELLTAEPAERCIQLS